MNKQFWKVAPCTNTSFVVISPSLPDGRPMSIIVIPLFLATFVLVSMRCCSSSGCDSGRSGLILLLTSSYLLYSCKKLWRLVKLGMSFGFGGGLGSGATRLAGSRRVSLTLLMGSLFAIYPSTTASEFHCPCCLRLMKETPLLAKLVATERLQQWMV